MDVLEVARELIRRDTSNPPGGEARVTEYIASLLDSVGIGYHVAAQQPGRNNLVARLAGRTDEAALLFHGHADVVPASARGWTYDPFGGVVDGGWLWGRGAQDMKGALAMMVTALLQIARNKSRPERDVVLAVFADEETGGALGAKWMVQKAPELFSGIQYAISEVGGASFSYAGKRLYPASISEKRSVRIAVELHGRPGHGSRPNSDNVLGRVGALLETLTSWQRPVRICDETRMMLEAMAATTGNVGEDIAYLLSGGRAREEIAWSNDSVRRLLEPLLCDTITPTVVHGGANGNVIPDLATVTLDCRLLPGTDLEEFLTDLDAHLPERAVREVINATPEQPPSDLGLMHRLSEVARLVDEDGVVIPALNPATTDSRHLWSLGIQTYGFVPCRMPSGVDALELLHSQDERIPVDALYAGRNAFHDLAMGA